MISVSSLSVLTLTGLLMGLLPLAETNTMATGQDSLVTAMPSLFRENGVMKLKVDGNPFLILGGELHNSTASNLGVTAPIFPRLHDMGLNTVIAPVYWELTEPREGEFDFSLVDGLVKQARDQRLRLILLWFGSFKNGLSTYPPPWVMGNPQRFPRLFQEPGEVAPYLSVFEPTNSAADAHAFAALMHHVREIDGQEHTVIMCQVENEVGVFSEDRDHDPVANQAFDAAVPKELMDYLAGHSATLLPETRGFLSRGKPEGTWTDVFGANANEIFMAWFYAQYLNKVTAAGKAEYPLPMYVNTWIKQRADDKGYPHGGPVASMHDIWRAGAPAIDILGLDIYNPDFKSNADLYSRGGNPLFIPETWDRPSATGRMLYAIGQDNAICVACFGVENMPANILRPLYQRLQAVAPKILAKMGTGDMRGVLFDNRDDVAAQNVNVGLHVLMVTPTVTPSANSANPAALLLDWDSTHVLVLGQGLAITSPDKILTCENGSFMDGKWSPTQSATEQVHSVSLHSLDFYMIGLR